MYEFPYSGYHTSSTPYSNYNTNPLLPNYTSPIDNLSPAITMHCTPSITSTPHRNPIVLQVSSDVSLNTILRQLGVDVNSLQRSSCYNNYYTPPVTEVILPPRSDHHRQLICHDTSDSDSDYYQRRSARSDRHQRLICHEAPDLERDYHQRRPFRPRRHRRIVCRNDSTSDSDDYKRHSSRHRRRQHQKQHHSSSDWNREQQSPPHLHSLLGNVWQRMAGAGAPDNLSLPQSQSNINQQWQAMLRNSPQSQSPSIQNAWRAMQTMPSPGNAPAANTSNQSSGGLASLFGRMGGAGGNMNPPPPPQQQYQASVPNFPAPHNVSTATNQPNSAVASMWGQMGNPSQQGPPPSAINSLWSQMASGSAPMNPGGNQMSPPPPPPPPPMNSLWSQMASAPPPTNPAGNQMSQPSSGVNSLWNQMAAAPPPTNPAGNQTSQPPSGVASFWSKMTGG
ncbi:unnamed protein product [Rotaria sordida]|uniref:Uncharacterized protein n=1 Tax=Rotaria sordida TaxID=392033 RepID=A0A815IDH4_9BILA|nr:unnamed protein product [Rotaria sordida]CAF1366655.1 unnamed protein product [Rotaria sordida]